MKALKLYYAVAIGMAMASGITRANPLRKPKPKKCLLPGWEKVTYHNGGYCSAAHCKEHKLVRRTMKNKRIK